MSSREPEDRGFRKIVPLARVQLLTDALFALSMMVILLQVEYPDPEIVVTDEQIREFFSEQVLALEVFAITFLLIAIYWVKHMEKETRLLVAHVLFRMINTLQTNAKHRDVFTSFQN